MGRDAGCSQVCKDRFSHVVALCHSDTFWSSSHKVCFHFCAFCGGRWDISTHVAGFGTSTVFSWRHSAWLEHIWVCWSSNYYICSLSFLIRQIWWGTQGFSATLKMGKIKYPYTYSLCFALLHCRMPCWRGQGWHLQKTLLGRMKLLWWITGRNMVMQIGTKTLKGLFVLANTLNWA